MTKQISVLLFLMILSVDGVQLDGSSVGVAWAASFVCSQIAAWARISKMSTVICLELGAGSWDTGSAGMFRELSFFLLSM